jgi:N-acetylmuramoyl-L-alanine amidase
MNFTSRFYFLLLPLFFFFFHFTSFAQDSTTTVIAKKGDGIYALLRNKGMNPYKYYDQFIELNIHNLRDSIHLYEGREYVLPTITNIDSTVVKTNHEKLERTISHEIFGEKFKETVLKSNRLKGNIYYLISGHGGPDPGTITTYKNRTLAEDEYAYDITLRLAKELVSHSATVYMIVRDENDGIRNKRLLTVDHDEVIYPKKKIPLGQLKRLQQRTETVNELYKKHQGAYRRLIVTHIDSRSKGENIDVFFYHHKKSKNGQKLAESIHNVFQKKYKKYQPNRTYNGTFSYRSLYLVNYTAPAMTYIEIGNLQNKKDQKRILYSVNRQALAEWISQGVLDDFEK